MLGLSVEQLSSEVSATDNAESHVVTSTSVTVPAIKAGVSRPGARRPELYGQLVARQAAFDGGYDYKIPPE